LKKTQKATKTAVSNLVEFNIANSAADCWISLKFGIKFDHMTRDTNS